MKKNVLLVVLIACIGFIACKKDKEELPQPKTYEDLDRKAIAARAASMKGMPVTASDAAGIHWKTGDVYIFKNRLNAFGKFRIISIDPADNHKLRIAAVTYNPDGRLDKQSDGFNIRGTFSADLALLSETTEYTATDFSWARETETNTFFIPGNGAVFAKYVF